MLPEAVGVKVTRFSPGPTSMEKLRLGMMMRLVQPDTWSPNMAKVTGTPFFTCRTAGSNPKYVTCISIRWLVAGVVVGGVEEGGVVVGGVEEGGAVTVVPGVTRPVKPNRRAPELSVKSANAITRRPAAF